MQHTITLSPDNIRSRIKAMSALHAYMDNPGISSLTDDDDPALNQLMTSAFANAMLHLRSWISDFTIEPTDFNNATDSPLTLSATFAVADNDTISWPVISGALHEYMAEYIMGKLWAHCPLGTIYTRQAPDTLSALTESLSLPVSGSMPRIARTI
ncbi:MAG: hypothetical protein K2K86_03375 [Muribaculaceae bacterium]|nr:hypothetical protein [Muribaculaceae bacterium]